MSGEEVLSKLECHFKWKPERDTAWSDIILQEKKILANIEENPVIEVQGWSLLGYMFTVGEENGTNIDYNKADEYFNKALDRVSCNGDKFVVMADKLHLLHRKNQLEDFKTLLAKVETLQKKLNDSSDMCIIKLIEAYSWSRFGIMGQEKALTAYKEAMVSDITSPDAHFGVGLILGRMRRDHDGNSSVPQQEEIDALKEAVVLWEYENAFSIAWYAYALASTITGYHIDMEVIIEVEELLEKALSVNYNNSAIVYKWCAKGYKQLCMKKSLPRNYYHKYIDRQKFCVDSACDANPCDSGSLHAAGLFYWRVKKDLTRAEELLQQASESCPLGNFKADFDLVKLRAVRHKGKYSARDGYLELLEKYENRDEDTHHNEKNIEVLRREISKFEEEDPGTLVYRR